MGVIAVKIKIMPESLESDLESIEKEARKIIIKNGGKNCKFEKEAIAFGLSALIAFFAWSEDKELEGLEKELEEVKSVGSVRVTDIRRAFG